MPLWYFLKGGAYLNLMSINKTSFKYHLLKVPFGVITHSNLEFNEKVYKHHHDRPEKSIHVTTIHMVSEFIVKIKTKKKKVIE